MSFGILTILGYKVLEREREIDAKNRWVRQSDLIAPSGKRRNLADTSNLRVEKDLVVDSEDSNRSIEISR